MSDIKWEEPPPSQQGSSKGGKWAGLLAEVRQRPGEWAALGPQSQGMASHIKAGRIGGAKPGEFETTTRSNGSTRPDLFVRFVGKPTLKSAAS